MKYMSVAVVVLSLLGATLSLRPAGAAGMTMVRVAHASPDAPAVDVYVDGAKAFTNVQFPQVTAYASLPSGSHHVQVFPAGAAATGKGVIDATLNLAAGKAYTVAAAGQLKSIAPVVSKDQTSRPASGTVRVRFVHLSPDAPKVDVAVARGVTLFKNVAFGKATRYLSVPARTYNFVVRVAGTKTVALRVNNVRLASGTDYTIFAEGLAMGTPKLQAVVGAYHPGM